MISWKYRTVHNSCTRSVCKLCMPPTASSAGDVLCVFFVLFLRAHKNFSDLLGVNSPIS